MIDPTTTNELEDSHWLHRQAMDLAFEASMKQSVGHIEAARDLTARALEFERKAANILENSDIEPTRAILFRSAASLAIDIGELREAEKLIARGLLGNPPTEIANELRDLFEQVNLDRHLNLRGIVLNEGEFQMSIVGDAVGFGVVESDVYLGRVQDVGKLITRTAERQANRPFRERGPSSTTVPVYLSVPRAASFAVTFRLGHPSQMSFPGINQADAVINELLESIQDLESGTGAIEGRIRDAAYRRNFLGLLKRIAPDGNAVRAVGFTASIRGEERRVLLGRRANQIGTPVSGPTRFDLERVEIEGTLKYADSRREQRDQIGIVDASGQTHKVRVPEGMMDDIVRPLWDFDVVIRGKRRGKFVTLEDISRRPV